MLMKYRDLRKKQARYALKTLYRPTIAIAIFKGSG